MNSFRSFLCCPYVLEKFFVQDLQFFKLAFLLWALIHILFLVDFRRKLVVFVEWAWLYFTGGRGARLITGDDRMPKMIKPPPDLRILARDSMPGEAPALQRTPERARKPA